MKKIVPIFFILLISACQAIYEDGKELASVVRKDVSEISLDQLDARVENGEEFVLIDVRQPGEYAAGNIPGSFNIPRGELLFKIADDAYWEEQFMYPPEKDSEIILYCKAGDRGVLAAKELQQIGFTNVHNVIGGWDAYANDGEVVAPAPAGGCGG